MKKCLRLGLLIFLTVFIARSYAFAEGMITFDFDEIQSLSKKGVIASDIEIYMEGLYGSDITLSQNTTAIKSIGKNSWNFNSGSSAALQTNGAYLKVGKGSGPSAITFDFGNNPINSFNVDWRIFKGGQSFAILADGVVIDQHTLSKAERKSGLAGHQDTYYFDSPVQRLEFIGLKKKSFAIDNLVINIPLPGNDEVETLGIANEQYDGPTGGNPAFDQPPGGENLIINQVTANVPEPSSLILLALGLCGAWLSRRAVAR